MTNVPGTNENIQSYPDEQIGYKASEEYQRSQQNTPLPESLSRTHTRPQSISESPFNSTAEDTQQAVHVDQPSRRFNKVTGGQESVNETQDAKAYASHPEADGHEYTVPILAQDEVAKSTGDFQFAAVSPKFERRSSYHDDDRSGAQTPTSRPASRPGSIYQMHSASHSLSRFLSHQDEREHMHTPLEDVAEYEPLFDETDEKNALSTAERFKRRPDLLQKRFPSQDIWEDTPNSAMYEATVSTPDLGPQADAIGATKAESTSTFEAPEKEHERKGEVSEADKARLIPKEQRLAQSQFAPHLRDDMPTKSRPSIAARFPSQDVWEDTPDSSYLVTTVGGPQEQDEDEETSPVDTKPPVPARPAKSRLGEGASSAQIEPSVAPNIPARPQRRVHAVPPADAKLTDPVPLSRSPELKKIPSIPDRPKPQIPPRPRKADEELTKVTSAGSNESAESQVSVKTKPQVPARPGGNIAALKGNFMSDLNKKLGLGPPKEKEKAPEPEEVKPLEDARKSRARGPQRRAPAKTPAPKSKSIPRFTIFAAQPLWQIDEADELVTIIETKAPTSSSIEEKAHAVEPETKAEAAERPDDAPAPLASGLAKNTAGESADPIPDESQEGELTRKTTATSLDGEQLERIESEPSTHVLPASKVTTASDDSEETQEQLEKVATREPETKAEDEPIKLRNEQVNAAAPERAQQAADSSISEKEQMVSDDRQGSSQGDDHPLEPMNEQDVDYDKLEEMTAKADGKLTAEEDPESTFSSTKVMD